MSFLKPCPEVVIQVLLLRVVVKVFLNAKITDPKYLCSHLLNICLYEVYLKCSNNSCCLVCTFDNNFKLCNGAGKLKSRKETPQKLTQLSSRSHPRHLVGKRTAQKDITIDTTSDSQVNSNFPNRWSPASLTFNNYFYLFLYLYIT